MFRKYFLIEYNLRIILNDRLFHFWLIAIFFFLCSLNNIAWKKVIARFIFFQYGIVPFFKIFFYSSPIFFCFISSYFSLFPFALHPSCFFSPSSFQVFVLSPLCHHIYSTISGRPFVSLMVHRIGVSSHLKECNCLPYRKSLGPLIVVPLHKIDSFIQIRYYQKIHCDTRLWCLCQRNVFHFFSWLHQ